MVYQVIAAEPGDGTLLDLPFGINDSFTGLGGWNPRAMYFQTITLRPILGAHISRVPARVFDAYAHMPVLARLAQIEQRGDFADADVTTDRERLAVWMQVVNLRYIVLPNGYQRTRGYAYVQPVFAGCLTPLPDDGLAFGYRVSRACGMR